MKTHAKMTFLELRAKGYEGIFDRPYCNQRKTGVEFARRKRAASCRHCQRILSSAAKKGASRG